MTDDPNFYSRIGGLGGEVHRKKPGYFTKLGAKGGEATAARLQNPEYRAWFKERILIGKGLLAEKKETDGRPPRS